LHSFEKLSQLERVDGAVLAPSGDRLATWKSVKHASKLLVWEVKLPAGDRSGAEGKALWDALAEKRMRPAHQAMRVLAAAPDRAVALFRERLRPAAGEAIDDKKIRQWIKDLDDDAFEVRQRATAALARFGAYLRPTLKKARDATASLETKLRLDDLLGAMDRPPTSEELRDLRAVDVLEQIGTKEARKLLRALASGATQASLTQAASRALKRLERPGIDP
jgi:hypothetical protein